VIRWAAPQYLVLLFSVPIVALAMIVGAWLRRRSLKRLADPALVPRLTDSRSPRLAALRAACLLLGLFFLLIALARPQWGEKLQMFKGRGIDIVVALDASKSMLATDVRPNRLSRAKTQIAALLDNLSSNRVGIVAFAGEAQVMCPLTPDVDAAKLFLEIIDPDNMPRPGTNIQRAVEAAAGMFDPQTPGSRALVLVTDGDNLDGDPAATTKLAIEQGIRIFAVGVGTPEGSTIPESQGSGTSYKKDQDDKIVVSRLAERLLLVMAKATDGRYFRSESIRLDQLAAALDQLQKKAIGGAEYMQYEERYQSFLLAAFLLIFAGLLMSNRRGAWFVNLGLPRWRLRRVRASDAGAPHAAPPVALLLGLTLCGVVVAAGGSADVGSSMRQGLSLERQGKYDQAVRAFQEALVLEPDNIRIRYDLGRALYESKQPAEAAQHFQLGVLSKSRPLRARSLYNLGNCQVRQNQLEEAIVSYTQSLLQRPDDAKAKQNLEYCRKLLQQQKQQPDSTQKNQQQKQQQQRPQPQPREQAQQAPPPAEQKGAISKEQADRMLQALQSRERENLKNQPKKPPARAAGGKDW
jgi:Ca-activated chloride channel homolog